MENRLFPLDQSSGSQITAENPYNASEFQKHITGKGTLDDPFVFIDNLGRRSYWENESKKWIAEPEQALIARQQVIYKSSPKLKNNVDNSRAPESSLASSDAVASDSTVAPKEVKRKRKKKKASKNTNIYVQGLPLDITEEEFISFFSKGGIIKKDEETAQPKVKLYRDNAGKLKGDGLVCYFRPESIDLAIKLLDGAEIRPHFPVSISVATFHHQQQQQSSTSQTPSISEVVQESQGQDELHLKSDENEPVQETLQKRKPKTIGSKSKKIKRYNQQRELSWDEDDNVHVILKNMFDQKEAWESPNFFLELEEEVRNECETFGEVKSLKIFERNPEGVIAIKFTDHEDALMCIDKMSGRWFAGKQIEADFYDGFTNYEVKETEEQQKERIQNFHSWIESQND